MEGKGTSRFSSTGTAQGNASKSKSNGLTSSRKLSSMGDKEKQELWAELGLDDSSVEELEMEAGPSTTSTGSAGKGIISNSKKDLVGTKPSRSKTKSKNSMAAKNNKRPASKSGELSTNTHDKGDKVYAAWWSQDLDRNSAPPTGWYSGTIKTYKLSSQQQVQYSVVFDDGDKLDNLEKHHVMTKPDYLKKMKKELKPLFDKGDEVYAAFWPDDKRSASTPSWYPGKVKNYRVVKGSDGGVYGSTRFYDIEFDDGDKINNLEDAYIFNKEDYLLTIRLDSNEGPTKRKWLGVKNVVDEKSSDLWANLVGWYTADINGEEHIFSLLSDALRAHDAHVMETTQHTAKKSQLNLPEEWSDVSAAGRGGEGSPRKPKSKPVVKEERRVSSRVNATIMKKIQVGSRILVKWPKDGHLYKATAKKLSLDKEPQQVTVHFDGRKKQSLDDIHPSLIKDFIKGENDNLPLDKNVVSMPAKKPAAPRQKSNEVKAAPLQKSIPKPVRGETTEDSKASIVDPKPENVSNLSALPISDDIKSLLLTLSQKTTQKEGSGLGINNSILKEALDLYQQKHSSAQLPDAALLPAVPSSREVLAQSMDIGIGEGNLSLTPDRMVSSSDIMDDESTVFFPYCVQSNKGIDRKLSCDLSDMTSHVSMEGMKEGSEAEEDQKMSARRVSNGDDSSDIDKKKRKLGSTSVSSIGSKDEGHQKKIKVKVIVSNSQINKEMVAIVPADFGNEDSQTAHSSTNQRRQFERSINSKPIILQKNFFFRDYHELEDYLLSNRTEYLESKGNTEQRNYTNNLTKGLLELAAKLNYVFDESCFDFVAVRKRVVNFYNSYAQGSKKREAKAKNNSVKQRSVSPTPLVVQGQTVDAEPCLPVEPCLPNLSLTLNEAQIEQSIDELTATEVCEDAAKEFVDFWSIEQAQAELGMMDMSSPSSEPSTRQRSESIMDAADVLLSMPKSPNQQMKV